MNIEKYENDMGGISYEIPIGTPLNLIPEEVKNNITDTEKSGILNITDSLKEIASKSPYNALSSFINYLQTASKVTFEYHTSEFVNSQALFRFELKNGLMPAIGLPDYNLDTVLPETLKKLYRTIGSTKHEYWMMAGGIFQLQDIKSIEDLDVWIDEDSNEVDPAKCFAFYSTRFGDNICFNQTDKSFIYEHESGRILEWISLEEFIDSYFNELLAGRFVKIGT